MKKLVLTLLSVIFAISAFGQNDFGKADDMSRIVLTPYIVDLPSIPPHVATVLKNKLNQVVTQHGVGGNALEPRFVITANLIEMTKEITPSMPPMVAMTVAPTIYIGDAQTGELYASCALPWAKGVGENETKAYMAAVKRVNTNSQEVVNCINQGKTKIIEYYNSQIDFLIAEAESLHKSQKFDDAMVLLASVPTICKDAHAKAMTKIAEIYQTKIDVEGAVLYNEAYALWHSNKTQSSALKCVDLLSDINPLSKSAASGRKLVASIEGHYAEIAARRRELEERKWAFKMQQYQDQRSDIKTEQEFRQRQQEHDNKFEVTKYELDHQHRTIESRFNYEVAMERAKSGAEKAEYALQNVKEVLMGKQMSGQNANGFNNNGFNNNNNFNANNAKPKASKGGVLDKCADKIRKWLNG